MASIILGYRISGCWGYELDPGGWSFVSYRKGTVRFKTYLLNGKVTSSSQIKLPVSVMDEIYQVLQQKWNIIERLPAETNNHSCDGSYHSFNFLGKKISSLNISRYPEEKIKEAESQGLMDAEYAKTMRNENTVLDIFEMVVPILVPYGLQVIFDPYFSCEWKGIDGWS